MGSQQREQAHGDGGAAQPKGDEPAGPQQRVEHSAGQLRADHDADGPSITSRDQPRITASTRHHPMLPAIPALPLAGSKAHGPRSRTGSEDRQHGGRSTDKVASDGSAVTPTTICALAHTTLEVIRGLAGLRPGLARLCVDQLGERAPE